MSNRPIEQLDRINHLLRECLAITDVLSEVDPFALEDTTVPILATSLAEHLREVQYIATRLFATSTDERKESEE